jgi:hypothetical protein
VQELLVSFLMVVLLFVEKNQARKKSIEFKIQKNKRIKTITQQIQRAIIPVKNEEKKFNKEEKMVVEHV